MEKNTDVAVKQLLVKNLSAESEQEFEAEARIMASLTAPNIVQFYGYCVSPERCLVMEYMPRGSLYHVLHSPQPLEWTIRMDIATDIAAGVSFLHAAGSAGIIHRDIKSLNVLLDKHFRAKLTDFGLSKVKHESQSVSTHKDGAAGTPAWMAPELSDVDEDGNCGECTKASDIYSLGITFWELISRDRPFKKVANSALIPGMVNKGYRDKIPSDCPPKLATLIPACWDTKPQNRPNADTVVTYLKSGLSDFPSFLNELKKTTDATTSSGYLSNLHSIQSTSGYQPNDHSKNPVPEIQQLSISASVSATSSTSSFFTSTSSNQPMRLSSTSVRESDALVNQLLLHIVHGEQDEAEKMLQEHAALLLKPGRVTDYSGRSIEGTALQIALGSYDDRMVKMLLPYFDKVQAGDAEKSRQYEAFLQVADEKKAVWDKELADLDEMVVALQKAPEAADNCETALEKFRKALITQGVIKGYHFNPELFIKAGELYEKHYDAFGGYNKPKTNLFAVKVIGYIQRFFPANIAQAFCYGLYDVVHKSEDPGRSLKFRYNSTTTYFPLIASTGVGFAYFTFGDLCGDAGPGKSGTLAYRTLPLFQNLCRAKVTAMQKFMRHPESQSDQSQLMSTQ